ncbi:hypothetical protein GCM10018779_41670 [Streptomyces griseocarneus]|nr:hypothetical protein GCM10018779_41670 [Streptomyces griseocarneus]
MKISMKSRFGLLASTVLVGTFLAAPPAHADRTPLCKSSDGYFACFWDLEDFKGQHGDQIRDRHRCKNLKEPQRSVQNDSIDTLTMWSGKNCRGTRVRMGPDTSENDIERSFHIVARSAWLS